MIIDEDERKIKEVETPEVRTIVSSEGERREHQFLVDPPSEALLTDYPDVLADEIGPNPPVQGGKCEARNSLKEGATAKKMRLMQKNGERREATETLTDD